MSDDEIVEYMRQEYQKRMIERNTYTPPITENGDDYPGYKIIPPLYPETS